MACWLLLFHGPRTVGNSEESRVSGRPSAFKVFIFLGGRSTTVPTEELQECLKHKGV